MKESNFISALKDELTKLYGVLVRARKKNTPENSSNLQAPQLQIYNTAIKNINGFFLKTNEQIKSAQNQIKNLMQMLQQHNLIGPLYQAAYPMIHEYINSGIPQPSHSQTKKTKPSFNETILRICRDLLEEINSIQEINFNENFESEEYGHSDSEDYSFGSFSGSGSEAFESSEGNSVGSEHSTEFIENSVGWGTEEEKEQMETKEFKELESANSSSKQKESEIFVFGKPDPEEPSENLNTIKTIIEAIQNDLKNNKISYTEARNKLLEQKEALDIAAGIQIPKIPTLEEQLKPIMTPAKKKIEQLIKALREYHNEMEDLFFINQKYISSAFTKIIKKIKTILEKTKKEPSVNALNTLSNMTEMLNKLAEKLRNELIDQAKLYSDLKKSKSNFHANQIKNNFYKLWRLELNKKADLNEIIKTIEKNISTFSKQRDAVERECYPSSSSESEYEEEKQESNYSLTEWKKTVVKIRDELNRNLLLNNFEKLGHKLATRRMRNSLNTLLEDIEKNQLTGQEIEKTFENIYSEQRGLAIKQKPQKPTPLPEEINAANKAKAYVAEILQAKYEYLANNLPLKQNNFLKCINLIGMLPEGAITAGKFYEQKNLLIQLAKNNDFEALLGANAIIQFSNFLSSREAAQKKPPENKAIEITVTQPKKVENKKNTPAQTFSVKPIHDSLITMKRTLARQLHRMLIDPQQANNFKIHAGKLFTRYDQALQLDAIVFRALQRGCKNKSQFEALKESTEKLTQKASEDLKSINIQPSRTKQTQRLDEKQIALIKKLKFYVLSAISHNLKMEGICQQQHTVLNIANDVIETGLNQASSDLSTIQDTLDLLDHYKCAVRKLLRSGQGGRIIQTLKLQKRLSENSNTLLYPAGNKKVERMKVEKKDTQYLRK